MLCPYANINCEHCKEEAIPYTNIIDNLSLNTGKKYRYVEATKKLIAARWKEGFRYPDFVKVHENTTKAWSGTEYEIYLRPSTLYCASKFEGYLNYKNGNGVNIQVKESAFYERMEKYAKEGRMLNKETMGDALYEYAYKWLTDNKIKWPLFCHNVQYSIPMEEMTKEIDFKSKAAGE